MTEVVSDASSAHFAELLRAEHICCAHTHSTSGALHAQGKTAGCAVHPRTGCTDELAAGQSVSTTCRTLMAQTRPLASCPHKAMRAMGLQPDMFVLGKAIAYGILAARSSWSNVCGRCCLPCIRPFNKTCG